MCHTFLDGQFTGLHHIARRIDQFHIQHGAHVGWLAVVRTDYIPFEPDCLAHKVSRVIKVQIHLLLRHGLRKVHSTFHVGQHADEFAVVLRPSTHYGREGKDK